MRPEGGYKIWIDPIKSPHEGRTVWFPTKASFHGIPSLFLLLVPDCRGLVALLFLVHRPLPLVWPEGGLFPVALGEPGGGLEWGGGWFLGFSESFACVTPSIVIFWFSSLCLNMCSFPNFVEKKSLF